MFADPQVIKHGNSLHVQHGDDKNLIPEFDTKEFVDKEKSIKAGRPIHGSVEIITIRIIGDKNTVVVRPVDFKGNRQYAPDPQRFAPQWNAFKNKDKVVIDGTSIKEWPPLTKAQALDLKAINIHTVEALAGVSDANLANIGMGARALREKAILYLANAKNNSGTSVLADEVKQLKKKISLLEAQSKKVKNNGKNAT